MRRYRRKKIIVIILVIFAVIAIAFGAAYFYFTYKIDKSLDNITHEELDVEVEEDEAGDKGYTQIALFGVDSRSSKSAAYGNSDSIIIASIDNVTKEVKLASVYRDTYLNVGNDTYRKANYAFAAGGASRAVSMLNSNLDLQITDYISIDFTALVEMVDLLGGIKVDVSYEEASAMQKYIVETAYATGYTDEAIYVSEGEQTLNGVQAVAYARIRKLSGGDYSRTERQRIVIKKLMKKIKKADSSTLLKVLEAITDDMATSYTTDEIKELISDASDYKMGDTTGFPTAKTSDTVGSVGSIVIPVNLDNNVEELHEFLFPEEDGYTVSDTVENYSYQIVLNLGQYTADETEDDDSSETDTQ